MSDSRVRPISRSPLAAGQECLPELALGENEEKGSFSMTEKQREMIFRLIYTLEEAHDQHVWDKDDDHPKEGCAYCLLTKEARLMFGDPQ